MHRKIIYIIVILLTGSLSSFAQTPRVDSLTKQYYRATAPGQKMQLLEALFEENHSLNRDSLDEYTKQAAPLLKENSNLHKRTVYQLGLAYAYVRWGWMDSALATINDALKNNTGANTATRTDYLKLMRLKALAYGGHSNLKEALAILYQLTSEAESWHDSLNAGANLNTIGSVSMARGNAHEALGWFSKAEAFTGSGPLYDANRAAIFTNRANAWKMLGNMDSADLHINRAIALAKQAQNLNTLTTAYRVQSDICLRSNRVKEAEAALQAMFDVKRPLNGGVMVQVDDNIMLVDFYLNTGQIQKAIKLCQDNLLQGDVYDTTHKNMIYTNNINIRLQYYEALARSYKAAGMQVPYGETLEQLIAAKDSFYEANSAEAIAELNTKYEVQKKETTIVQQKLDLVRKNNLLYGSIALILFLGIVSYLVFINYRKRQQFRLQQMQEEEKRISAIAVLDAEEKERRRISADLHDNLGAYANAVLYNTELLQQEQDVDERKELMNDLQYASKDIITSLRETIWALKKDTFTAEDCLLRIRNFIQPFNRYYPQTSFVVEGLAPEALSMQGSRALHLVRMVQEAVNNAIKHAAATRIIVSSTVSDGYWKIVIEDNGKGFEHNASLNNTEHHGLANLTERGRAAHIGLSVQSTPGRGTTVELSIKEDSLIQK